MNMATGPAFGTQGGHDLGGVPTQPIDAGIPTGSDPGTTDVVFPTSVSVGGANGNIVIK